MIQIRKSNKTCQGFVGHFIASLPGKKDHCSFCNEKEVKQNHKYKKRSTQEYRRNHRRYDQ